MRNGDQVHGHEDKGLREEAVEYLEFDNDYTGGNIMPLRWSIHWVVYIGRASMVFVFYHVGGA